MLVVPGRAFGTPGYFRMSYCVDDRTITSSLARLRKVLQEFNLCYNIATWKTNMERRKTKAPTRDSVADNIAELQTKAETEPIAAFLGMRLIELSEGYAKVAMKLRPEYINFVGLVFGGIITSLVDEAFAYATNSVITPNVASQLNIHFIAGADVNDELTAECRVVKAGKRVCISEMTVVNQDGKLIASATGTTIPIINS
jgi:acyl-CoA thioesterase